MTKPVSTFPAASNMASPVDFRVCIGIKSQHGGKSLGNGFGGNHYHFPIRSQGNGLFRGENDILIVGQHKDFLAGVASTASRISSVLGFMVCPPLTTVEQPKSRNNPLSPSPAATETKPISSVGS